MERFARKNNALDRNNVSLHVGTSKDQKERSYEVQWSSEDIQNVVAILSQDAISCGSDGMQVKTWRTRIISIVSLKPKEETTSLFIKRKRSMHSP